MWLLLEEFVEQQKGYNWQRSEKVIFAHSFCSSCMSIVYPLIHKKSTISFVQSGAGIELRIDKWLFFGCNWNVLQCMAIAFVLALFCHAQIVIHFQNGLTFGEWSVWCMPYMQIALGKQHHQMSGFARHVTGKRDNHQWWQRSFRFDRLVHLLPDRQNLA